MFRVRSSPTPGKPPGKAEKSLCSSSLLPAPDYGMKVKGSGFFALANPPLALMPRTTLELEHSDVQTQRGPRPLYMDVGPRHRGTPSMETEWAPGVTPNALRANSAAVVTKNSSIP